MRSALAGLALAVLAAATGPDLSWIIDAELDSRRELALSQAETLDARAATLDAERVMLVERRDGAREERDRVAATVEELSRVKRGLAESRIKELDGQIAGWETRIGALDRQAGAARQDAETRRTFAAAIAGEAALRARQEADAVPRDAEGLARLSDARLQAAKTFYARRMARVPAQLGAIERMTRDPSTTPAVRASLVGRAGEVRTLREEDAGMVERIDEELRFRAETKAEEVGQAELLERAASAKAGVTEAETPVLVSAARSAELDVALDRIIAAEDDAARRKAARGRATRLAIRWGVGTLVLAGAGGLLWVVAIRGMSGSRGRSR